MKRSGAADLVLSGGRIPPWLFSRMKQLSLPIVESILQEKGLKDFLSRLSDPYWFQSFGAVIGMDWNTSGVTTSVLAALKASINPHAEQLGIYICGGKGKDSLKTPAELLDIAEKTGLDGVQLAHSSRLSAKVDNTAVQDGFNLYLHSFILSADGDWTVIQQGMEPKDGKARRYHWHSEHVKSFIEEPHSAVCGENQGAMLNLVHADAKPTQEGMLRLTRESPEKLLAEMRHLRLPRYGEVKERDVDMKRLGSILWLAQEQPVQSFDELLLLKGLGPRTLQSLTLVSELIHGTPSRFSDPARFSFAHGGKSGSPFPVPTRIYDESIATLKDAVSRAKIGQSDKAKAIASLSKLAQRAEEGFTPKGSLNELIQEEKRQSDRYGGRSVIKRPKSDNNGKQLDLF